MIRLLKEPVKVTQRKNFYKEANFDVLTHTFDSVWDVKKAVGRGYLSITQAKNICDSFGWDSNWLASFEEEDDDDKELVSKKILDKADAKFKKNCLPKIESKAQIRLNVNKLVDTDEFFNDLSWDQKSQVKNYLWRKYKDTFKTKSIKESIDLADKEPEEIAKDIWETIEDSGLDIELKNGSFEDACDDLLEIVISELPEGDNSLWSSVMDCIIEQQDLEH